MNRRIQLSPCVTLAARSGAKFVRKAEPVASITDLIWILHLVYDCFRESFGPIEKVSLLQGRFRIEGG